MWTYFSPVIKEFELIIVKITFQYFFRAYVQFKQELEILDTHFGVI